MATPKITRKTKSTDTTFKEALATLTEQDSSAFRAVLEKFGPICAAPDPALPKALSWYIKNEPKSIFLGSVTYPSYRLAVSEVVFTEFSNMFGHMPAPKATVILHPTLGVKLLAFYANLVDFCNPGIINRIRANVRPNKHVVDFTPRKQGTTYDDYLAFPTDDAGVTIDIDDDEYDYV